MIAALLAGGVLDAPGAVGNSLIDLLLLDRAGVNDRGVVLGRSGGGSGRGSGLGGVSVSGVILEDGVQVQVVVALVNIAVPEHIIVRDGVGYGNADGLICVGPLYDFFAVGGGGNFGRAAHTDSVDLDGGGVGVVVDKNGLAGHGHKVGADVAAMAEVIVQVNARAHPIVQGVIGQLLAGGEVPAVAHPVGIAIRQGGHGQVAGVIRGDGHRIIAIEIQAVGVQVAQRLAGFCKRRNRHADCQCGDRQ